MGTSGEASDFAEFSVIIQDSDPVDPCPTASLSLKSDPIPSFTTYSLGNQAITYVWDETTLLMSNIDANCGDPVCEFTNFDGSSITAPQFSYTRDKPTGTFQIKMQEDTSTINTYPFKLTCYFEEAPLNKVESSQYVV